MVFLYLARHGETLENAAQTLQGQSPGHLSAKGIEQAEALQTKLKDKSFDVLVCSDLQRALDTANIINVPHRLPVIACPLLRERDWGSLTGRYIPDVRNQPFPKDIESIESMFARAEEFIAYLIRTFDNQHVLAVGHGLFNRIIQATLYNKGIHDIPRMENAEVRQIEIPTEFVPQKRVSGDEEADN